MKHLNAGPALKVKEFIEPDEWCLAGLAVRPAYRRKGIGKHLTEMRIEDNGRKRSLSIFVGEDNKASRKLHEELGFSTANTNDGFVVMTLNPLLT